MSFRSCLARSPEEGYPVSPDRPTKVGEREPATMCYWLHTPRLCTIRLPTVIAFLPTTGYLPVMRPAQRTAILSFSVAVLVYAAAARADWPRFRGPNGDGICTETGLLQKIPAGGPKLLWSLDGCGVGYSSVSIADGRLITMGDRDVSDGEKGQFVIAFDLDTRKQLWATPIGPPHNDGPRCTPTIDGESRVRDGHRRRSGVPECADRRERRAGRRACPTDFGGKMMSVWQFQRVAPGRRRHVCFAPPAGPDATLVALNKETGDVIWKCAMPDIGNRGKDGAGYATRSWRPTSTAFASTCRSSVAARLASRRKPGRFLWGYNRDRQRRGQHPSPVVRGNHRLRDHQLQDRQSALLKITRDGDKTSTPKKSISSSRKDFENHHGGVVLVGDSHLRRRRPEQRDARLPGFPHGRDQVEGRRLAPQGAPGGSAAVLYADGHLVFRYEKDALVAVIEATPDEFRVQGVFTADVDGGKNWAHPVIHDGKLYLRAKDTLMCYDVSGG